MCFCCRSGVWKIAPVAREDIRVVAFGESLGYLDGLKVDPPLGGTG